MFSEFITFQKPLPIFIVGIFFTILAIFGLAGFLQSEWFTDPGPYPSGTWHGYTLNTFIGLMGFTFFTSIGIALVLISVSQGARRTADNIASAMRWNSARVGIAVTFLIVGSIGIFTWGWEVFQCLGVFCVGDAYQDPGNVRPLAGDGWLVIVAAAAFFSLVPLGLIMLRASWNSLHHPSPIKNVSGHGCTGNSGPNTEFECNADPNSPLLACAPKKKPSANPSTRDSTGLLHVSEGDFEQYCDGKTAKIKINRSSTADKTTQSVQSLQRQASNGEVDNMSRGSINNPNNANSGANKDIADLLLEHEQLNHQNLLLKPISNKYFILRTLGIFLVLFIFFISTLIIPNSWEYFSASRISSYAHVIAMNDFDGANGTCAGAYGVYTCTEYGWAWFTTGNIFISKDLVLKLFPSNLFFFAYLFLMLIGGAFLHLALSKSSGFTRVRLFGGADCGFRFSFAELTGWFLTVLMMTLYSIYWFHDHNYLNNGSAFSSGVATSERVARGFGQLAVAFMGLLMFPSSRNSVLHSTLGTSWESLLRVHRILGYCMLICVFIHMVTWWVKYAQLGAFPSNIIAVPLSVEDSADNFTVPIANWSTWVLLVCMLFLAFEPVRRRWFELFYYSHLFAAYAAIPAVLWHAAAGWEYLVPGLTVWFLDRLVRFARSQRIVSVISTKVCDDGVTELRFQQPGLVVRPGQYVFLNVAELSLLQWHPFSISSIDNVNHIFSLHIKAMPSSDEESLTWTQELRRAVQKNAFPLTLSVDGPYGPLHDFSDFECVILVAGGIGITPCASIAESLRNNPDGMRMELHWCLREPELAADFVGQLSQGDNPSYNATLYCSRQTATPAELCQRSGGFNVKSGRPNWEHLFLGSDVHTLNHDPSKVLVFACGPAQLVDECAQAAIQAGFTFHEETFFL